MALVTKPLSFPPFSIVSHRACFVQLGYEFTALIKPSLSYQRILLLMVDTCGYGLQGLTYQRTCKLFPSSRLLTMTCTPDIDQQGKDVFQ